MAFPLSAFVAIVLQLFGPVVFIAMIALVLRPGRVAGSWVAGPGAAPVGAALFLLAMLLKLALRKTGVVELGEDGMSGMALVRDSIVHGVFASVTEEVVRFAAAALLFRRVAVALDPEHALRPMHVALLFGLGWGGVEAAITGLTALVQTVGILEMADGNLDEIPIPFFPLVGAAERLFAIMLHIALSAIAARAAGEIACRRAGHALAFFAAAVVIHAAVDAVVHYHATPARRAFEFEDYPRGVHGFLLLELWFAGGAITSFAWARRLGAARARE